MCSLATSPYMAFTTFALILATHVYPCASTCNAHVRALPLAHTHMSARSLHAHFQVQYILGTTAASGRSIVWDLRASKPIIQFTECVRHSARHLGPFAPPQLSLSHLHQPFPCVLPCFLPSPVAIAGASPPHRQALEAMSLPDLAPMPKLIHHAPVAGRCRIRCCAGTPRMPPSS